MKRIALAGLIVVLASLTVVPSSEARDRGHSHHHRPAVHARVFVGVGPAVWWGPYPYWYYPPPYAVYAPPVVYAPPPRVVYRQPVYVQPAPVYVRSGPVYVAPAPVLAYPPPVPYFYCRPRYHARW